MRNPLANLPVIVVVVFFCSIGLGSLLYARKVVAAVARFRYELRLFRLSASGKVVEGWKRAAEHPEEFPWSVLYIRSLGVVILGIGIAILMLYLLR